VTTYGVEAVGTSARSSVLLTLFLACDARRLEAPGEPAAGVREAHLDLPCWMLRHNQNTQETVVTTAMTIGTQNAATARSR